MLKYGGGERHHSSETPSYWVSRINRVGTFSETDYSVHPDQLHCKVENNF